MKKMVFISILTIIFISVSFFVSFGKSDADLFGELPEGYKEDSPDNYFISEAYNIIPILQFCNNKYYEYESVLSTIRSKLPDFEISENSVLELYNGSFFPADTSNKLNEAPVLVLLSDRDAPPYYAIVRSYYANHPEKASAFNWNKRMFSTDCEVLKNAFIAPWTYYQNGSYYTWNDIVEMDSSRLQGLDFSSYAFFRYISSIKQELQKRGWWKESYLSRYNELIAHQNDYFEASSCKDSFSYKGTQRRYSELLGEIELYGSSRLCICYSDAFDYLSDEFENVVLQCDTQELEQFCKDYKFALLNDEYTLKDKIDVYRYTDAELFDWSTMMVCLLSFDSTSYDDLKSSVNSSIPNVEGCPKVPFAAVYAYFQEHPISVNEARELLASQYGVSHLLGKSDIDSIAKALSEGSLYDLAECFSGHFEYISDPRYFPCDIRRYPNQQEQLLLTCQDRERTALQIQKAKEYVNSGIPALDLCGLTKQEFLANCSALLSVFASTVPTGDGYTATFSLLAAISLAGAGLLLSRKKKNS